MRDVEEYICPMAHYGEALERMVGPLLREHVPPAALEAAGLTLRAESKSIYLLRLLPPFLL